MYNNILLYLRTGKLPEDLGKNQKDALRRKSKNFLEKSGLLYFRDEKKSVDLQVGVCSNNTCNNVLIIKMIIIIKFIDSSCGNQQIMQSGVHFTLQVVVESQKRHVLEGCHSDELGGGHFGRDKTLSKVSERYYWLGMVNDVKEFCRTCDKCQRANRYSYSVICCEV